MSFDDQAEPDSHAEPDEQPEPDGQADTYFDYLADVPADATRVDPAAGPDPFASWYRRDDPTETVRATPTEPVAQTQGYERPQEYQQPPAGQGGPAGPPVPPAGPPRGNGRRGLFLVIAVVLVLAAGGGAYALASSLGKHPAGQPTGTGSAGASLGTSASPVTSLVAIGSGVGSSAAKPTVETLLSQYFDGINKHDYARYAATLTPANQADQPQSNFASGYGTTTDSAMTLTALTGDGSGGLTATVTFTSRQAPAKSVDGSACNDWTLNLYLVPQGSGYLIGPSPSGYKPSYSDC